MMRVCRTTPCIVVRLKHLFRPRPLPFELKLAGCVASNGRCFHRCSLLKSRKLQLISRTIHVFGGKLHALGVGRMGWDIMEWDDSVRLIQEIE